MAVRVLIVDDERTLADVFARLLRRAGYETDTAYDGAGAIAALRQRAYDAVIADVNLPDHSGLEILECALATDSAPCVLLISGSTDLPTAIDGMRRGATDFIEKPVESGDLVVRLERALQTATMRRKLRALESRQREQRTPLFGTSAAMRRALDLADKVAATPNSSALLLGESGTGKEVLATRIHEASDRRSGPFVRVNLAAIPETMIEAELFGSVRGAFTDAKRDRSGFFAAADGGTLLLDELGEFRSEHQAKLLRALEERRFFPVGSDRERSVNVRVLAATNRDPRQMVAAGTLRPDLFYRLATVTIELPPLRERRDEIAALAAHFVDRFGKAFGRRQPPELTPAAVQVLEEYPWPGNIRQLRNVLERAVMLTSGAEIGVEALDLPADVPSQPAGPEPAPASQEDLDPRSSAPPLSSASRLVSGEVRLEFAKVTAVAELERAHIERALKVASGSKTYAAQLLGVSRTTLWTKMKRYGLE